jgi:superfamily II DNA or RNA helicase
MIGFAYSRKNGEDTAAEFRAKGISAVFLDGETPDHIRIAAIEKFADREIDVLINCQLFAEGFDLSAQVGRRVPIEAVGLWTPTKSLPRAHQMMMRPMRPQENPAILLDHVNMLMNHGFPDDEHDWSLDGHGKMIEGATPMVRCPSCFFAGRPCRVCPDCGHEFRGEGVPVMGRQVDEVAGEIEEVDVAAMRRARSIEEGRARTVPELAHVAVARGYRPGWVLQKLKARGEFAPPYDVVVRAMRDVARG